MKIGEVWNYTAEEFKAWEQGKAAQIKAMWETSRRVAYYIVAMNAKKPPRSDSELFRLPWVDGEIEEYEYDPEAEAELLRQVQARYDKAKPING